MVRACSVHAVRDRKFRILFRQPEGRDHFGHIGMFRRIILK